MSIQQDKRIVKPSKMSERYARWFETRVPSTSPIFRYIVILFLSVPMSFAAIILYFFVGQLFTFLIITVAGVVVYLLFLSFLKIRFHSNMTDQSFSQIVQSATGKVVSHQDVYFWPQSSSDPYIVSMFTILFSAILVSDSMIDLIKKMPDSGEALIAYHIYRTPKYRQIADLIIGSLIFIISSHLFSNIIYTLLSYSYSPFLIVYIFIMVYGNSIFIGTIFFVFAAKAVAWTHDSAFEMVLESYKTHPQVAKDEVLSSQKLDEEATRATVWVVREWENRKRSGRRASASIIVLVLVFLAEFLYITYSGINIYTPYLFYVSQLIYVLPIVISLLSYLALRRWDKRCMGEIYLDTSKTDEPIWVD